jgi:hypothetical protein
MGASAADLADADTLCIEAGGSGLTEQGNFDHHDPGGPSSSACRQAFDVVSGTPGMARLVDYVEAVDIMPHAVPAIGFPSLATLMSGLRLSISDPAEQFRAGLKLLRTVVDEGLDPFQPMPQRPEWEQYFGRKVEENEALDAAMRSAVSFLTRSGLPAGAVETGAIGALGRLYASGCAIGVVRHPAFGLPPVPKATIGGNDRSVTALVPHLAAIEPGWGGPAHGTILGSPFGGTHLTLEELIRVVEVHL